MKLPRQRIFPTERSVKSSCLFLASKSWVTLLQTWQPLLLLTYETDSWLYLNKSACAVCIFTFCLSHVIHLLNGQPHLQGCSTTCHSTLFSSSEPDSTLVLTSYHLEYCWQFVVSILFLLYVHFYYFHSWLRFLRAETELFSGSSLSPRASWVCHSGHRKPLSLLETDQCIEHAP